MEGEAGGDDQCIQGIEVVKCVVRGWLKGAAADGRGSLMDRHRFTVKGSCSVREVGLSLT